MQILYVTPEVAPYFGQSDLAEVSGALPRALQELQMKVTVVAPFWKGVDPDRYGLARRIRKLNVPLGGGTAEVGLLEGKFRNADVGVLLLDHAESFQRDGAPDHRTWYLLARAALEAASELGLNVDLVHAHGWQTGFVPLLLQAGAVPALAGVKLVFTVPEAEGTQLFEPAVLDELRLGYQQFNPDGIEFHGKVNLLKAGVLYADRVIAWSESYARDMRTEPYGAGLHGLFQAQAGKVRGILPGLDPAAWDPASDHRIAERYDGDSLPAKEACKRALQAELDLPVRPQLPLCAVLGPLTPARGADLLLRALPGLMPLMSGEGSRGAAKLQLCILGEPAPELAGPLADAAAGNAQSLAFRAAADGELLRRAIAGADALLLPLRQDPAGLLTMKALRYGALPIGPSLGALRDLVIDADPPSGTGNGFFMAGPQPEALQAAVQRMLAAHAHRPLWARLTHTAMRQRRGWDATARQTIQVYQDVLDQS
jgi:starch synthase